MKKNRNDGFPLMGKFVGNSIAYEIHIRTMLVCYRTGVRCCQRANGKPEKTKRLFGRNHLGIERKNEVCVFV